MDLELQLRFGARLHDEVEVPLDFVGEQDRGIHLSGTIAGGALLGGGDLDFGAHALTGDLHQAELAQRQDGVLGTVVLHGVAHGLGQLLAVLRVAHVDKVHHDDAADVPQPQLAGDLFRGLQIDLQHGLGLVLAGHFVAAVHVDRMHRLRVFNHDVGAARHGGRLAEGTFDLLGHAVAVENGLAVLMELHQIGAVLGDVLDVILDRVVQVLVVHHDLGKVRGEEVAQKPGRFVHLAE